MNESPNIRQMVLDLVLDDNYQPLKARAIAKKLDLLEEQREVKRSIKRLIKNGKLRYGDKHLVMKPAKRKRPDKAKADKVKAESGKKFKRKDNEVVGTFRKTSGGFGFVTPEDSVVTDRSEDIFVPRSRTGDAAHMDKVIVRIPKEEKSDPKKRKKGGKKSGKGPAGRIVRVLERYTHRFVGSYAENNGYGIVTVDGNTFEQGILVGDAGAKRCKIGDKVVIEMADFPSAHSPGEGVIVEVLGDRGLPGVDTRMIIAEFALPEEFPEAVLDDARRQAEAFDEEIGDRTDFTGKTVVTIDPKTARDFDDAISLEQLENGHWLLGVHIADVSHFVPFRSALDAEAYARSTSVYLPDKVIPMLPEVISNNLASLQPHRLRYCMTALIEFTDKGVPIATELHRGAIKSAHRFTYEEIDEYLEDDKPWKKKLEPEVFNVVRDMHTLAMKLRRRRMDRGAINLVLPEVRIDLDDDGKVCGAHTEENTESHQVIEEFMLAANEAVAQRLEDEGLFLIRRIHESPTEKKLQELTNFVQSLGIDCDNLKDRFELKRVVEESESMKESHAIHFAVLRTMQKAVYSPQEIGHYALASPAYCHFTSPIRRYPDLVIHRMVGDLVDGKKPKSNFDSLAGLGKHCSNLEKRAADAERELKKLKLLSFMEPKIGETLTGVVTGVESFGLFVQGIEIPAEGMIPIDSLPRDNYSYERYSRTLGGAKKKNQFRLGDQVVVEVAVVDWDKRLLEYRLQESDSSSGSKKKPARLKKSGTSVRSKPAKRSKTTEKRKANDEAREAARSRSGDRGKTTEKSEAPQGKMTRAKRKAKKDALPWENRRATGKTRKQREAVKKKKSKSTKKTSSGKSRKVQANKKKAKAAANKAARKKKVATAKAKQKKKGKKRKKS